MGVTATVMYCALRTMYVPTYHIKTTIINYDNLTSF